MLRRLKLFVEILMKTFKDNTNKVVIPGLEGKLQDWKLLKDWKQKLLISLMAKKTKQLTILGIASSVFQPAKYFLWRFIISI